MKEHECILRREFIDRFGDCEGAKLFFAPGRINLIGEHTDYNGGYVLPCTIDRGLWALARPRADRLVRAVSLNFPETGGKGSFEFDLDLLCGYPNQGWSAYLLGLLRAMRQNGHFFPWGFEVIVSGDLPIANGLSSSHALMVLFGLILTDLFQLPFEDEAGRIKLALLTQRVENQYIGVQSGVMDGFIIAVGGFDEALLLHCASLQYRRVDVRLPEAELWVIDSKVTRELSASAYNQRYEECTEALRLINRSAGYEGESRYVYLSELDANDWTRWQLAIEDLTIRRRGCHVISENLRTLVAAEALQAGEMDHFGKLLSASHRSLRDHYEVTGSALDTLAELCWQQSDCLGARMTGAGFGGCFIALFREGAAGACLERVAAGYRDRMGLDLEAFPYRGGVAGLIV